MKRNITDNPLPFFKADFDSVITDPDSVIEQGAYWIGGTRYLQLQNGSEAITTMSPLEVFGNSRSIIQRIFEKESGLMYYRFGRVSDGKITELWKKANYPSAI